MTEQTLLCKRPETLNAIGEHTKAVIEAHAGTGKTFTIEHLVIDLLLRDEAYRIEEILIVTFTDKAARELRERIRTLIEKVLYGHAEVTNNPSESHWNVDETARARLKQALFSFELAQISTIHSFCQRILKEAAFFSGGLMTRSLVGKRELFDKAYATCIREHYALEPQHRELLALWLESKKSLHDLADLLVKAFFRGVESPLGSNMPRLACCTNWSTLVQELEAIRSFLIDAVQDLGPKKFQTLRNRLGILFIDSEKHPDYFRSIANFEKAIRQSTCPTTRMELLTLLKNRHEKLCDAIKKTPGIVEELSGDCTPELLEAFKKAVTFLVEKLPLFTDMVLAEFLPPLYRELGDLKANNGMADFDDLLTDLATALHAPAGELAPLLRGRFRVALIDEFQDTDPVQWSIFRKVFFETPTERLYLVGDPKQAIYAFRGADVGTYLEAADEVVALTSPKKTNLIRLNYNFRSSRDLIAGYNLILSSKGSFFRNGGIHYDEPVLCGDSKAQIIDGNGAVVTDPIRLFDFQPPNGRPQWSLRKYRSELFRAVGHEILRITGTKLGKPPHRTQSGKGEKPVTYRDIFVLTERNSEAAEVARTLKQMQIPCTLYQGGSIFAAQEATEVACLLEAILFPHDKGNVSRAFLTPFFSMQLHDLDALWDDPENSSAMAQLQQWHDLLNTLTPPRLFQKILSDTETIPKLLAQADPERTVTNFLHLFELLERWYAELGSSLAELQERLKKALEEEANSEDSEYVQRLESDAETVRILTMHKSKGLEAAVVFLCGGFNTVNIPGIETISLQESDKRSAVAFDKAAPRFAAEKSLATQGERERLLYVALTRAGRLLYLPYMRWTKLGEDKRSGEEKFGWNVAGVNGVYEVLAARLRDLVEGNRGDAVERKSFAQMTSFIGSPKIAMPQITESEIAASSKVIPNTSASIGDDVSEALLHLTTTHAAPALASYTKLKHSADSTQSLKRDEAEVVLMQRPNLNANNLPAGAEFGICFHACMEHLDLKVVAASESCTQWSAIEDVRHLVESRMRAHGIAPVHKDYLFDLLHRNLTQTINFGAAETPLPNLAEAQFLSREVEFYFPWPEREHAEQLPFRLIDRGLMQGCCDILFAWRGKHYVLDWKTDLLPDYSEESCNARLQEQYLLQAYIYTVALTRMLAIADAEDYESRVGGYIYTFARGPRSIHGRFSWSDLQGFEAKLANANGMRWEE